MALALITDKLRPYISAATPYLKEEDKQITQIQHPVIIVGRQALYGTMVRSVNVTQEFRKGLRQQKIGGRGIRLVSFRSTNVAGSIAWQTLAWLLLAHHNPTRSI